MGKIWDLQGRGKFFVFCLEIAPIVSNYSRIVSNGPRIALEIAPMVRQIA